MMAAASASIVRDGERLRIAGSLDRAAACALWPRAEAAADGARVIDLSALDAVDSAGLALLVALAGRAGNARLEGMPRALADLMTAYRLTPSLGFESRS